MPAGEVLDYTYGLDGFSNSGPVPLTIDRVRLVDPNGFRLVDAFVTPIDNRTVLGNQQQWPPSPESPRAWAARVPAPNATVKREDGDRNLVLHLRADATKADFTAVEVDYRVGGRTLRGRTTTAFRIAPTC